MVIYKFLKGNNFSHFTIWSLQGKRVDYQIFEPCVMLLSDFGDYLD